MKDKASEEPLEDTKTIENEPIEPAASQEEQSKEPLETELAEWKDKYVRLYADFENLRKRAAKERLELIKTAGEEVFIALLPIVDDFERAIKSMETLEDSPAKEGIHIIAHKLHKILEAKGIKPMNALHEVFNAEIHEAITDIPVEDESLKGKIIDEIEKGYYLHDKVIRFAKVVVGK